MKNIYLFYSRIAVLAGILLGLSPSSLAVQQVFLIQNSGWMEPFYSDKNSQFKPLIAALIGTVSDQGENVAVATFSQSTASNTSPQMVYSGPAGTTEFGTKIAQLALARKGSGATLADTDFQEAIQGAIQALKRQPGILWIITNNKNSPGNDPDTKRRTREFYELLHNADPILRTVAFPLGMPVRGQFYTASGLMIYALAYGKAADEKLKNLVEGGRIAKVLVDKALRLKPLDVDPIEVSSESAGKVSGGNSLKVNVKENVMFIDIDADEAKASTVALRLRITNVFNPYRIDSAAIRATFDAGASGTMQLNVAPSQITNLSPGESGVIDVTFPLPVESVRSLWAIETIKELGKAYTLKGAMQLTMQNVKLSIPAEFKLRLNEIFPGDPMPDVFTPPSSVPESKVQIPVIVRIHYPVYPLIIIAIGCLMLIFGAIALISMQKTMKTFLITVNGRETAIALKRFSGANVKNNSGEVIGHVSRGWSNARLGKVIDGNTISINN